jgi:hypothetical protein
MHYVVCAPYSAVRSSLDVPSARPAGRVEAACPVCGDSLDIWPSPSEASTTHLSKECACELEEIGRALGMGHILMYSAGKRGPVMSR